MEQIQEVKDTQLNEIVNFVNRHWKEIGKRPGAKEDEKELAFWQHFRNTKRILIYRGTAGEIQAILTMEKDESFLRIYHFYVAPEFRRQGIGNRLLHMAERLSSIWNVNSILLKGRKGHEEFLPYFNKLGYSLHCSIEDKNNITLEKKLNASRY